MQGLFQAYNPISLLNFGDLELYSFILTFLMPKETNSEAVIKDIIRYTDRKTRIFTLIDQEIKRLTITNQQNDILLGFPTNAEYLCSDSKITALHELKRIIEINSPDLMDEFTVWEEQNRATLASQKVVISSFFCKTLTKTQEVVHNVKNILGLEEPCIEDEEVFTLLF